jgi:hypothetical protein
MATRANIIIPQGSSFSTTFSLTDENGDPLDLSGYSAASQMRKHHTSSNAVSFTIELVANAGTIGISLTANQTANVVSGRYVYDVETTDGTGAVSRVVEGIATVTPQVTR